MGFSSKQSDTRQGVPGKLVVDYEQKFKGKEIHRPTNWGGGYIVTPNLIEFWQGRKNRLHDRIQYTLNNDNSWKIERLAP